MKVADPIQCRQALDKANEVRIRAAEIRQDVKAGRLDWRAVIRGEVPGADTIPVARLMLAVKGIGQVKLDRILREADVNATRPIGRLTPRQRVALTDPKVGAEAKSLPRVLRASHRELREMLDATTRERDEALAEARRWRSDAIRLSRQLERYDDAFNRSNVIRERRTALGMSRAELAERAGCSEATIIDSEQGRIRVKSTTLPRILAALDMEGMVAA